MIKDYLPIKVGIKVTESGIDYGYAIMPFARKITVTGEGLFAFEAADIFKVEYWIDEYYGWYVVDAALSIPLKII